MGSHFDTTIVASSDTESVSFFYNSHQIFDSWKVLETLLNKLKSIWSGLTNGWIANIARSKQMNEPMNERTKANWQTNEN